MDYQQINKVYALSQENFIQLCEQSSSCRQISLALGYKNIGTYTYALLKQRIREINRPDLVEKLLEGNKKSPSIKTILASYTVEELQELISNSRTVTEILDKLGVKRTNGRGHSGRNFNALRKFCEQHNIDTSHFDSQVGIHNSTDKAKANIGEYFVNGIYRPTTNMRKIILREKLLPYVCSVCGNSGKWQGENLILQLHHIDGDNTNNKLSNLTFLCPNCHSQTQNFAARNHLSQVGKEVRENLTREQLKDKIRTQPLAKISKEFDISSSTLTCWCKEFNLPPTKKEINSYSDEEWEQL